LNLKEKKLPQEKHKSGGMREKAEEIQEGKDVRIKRSVQTTILEERKDADNKRVIKYSLVDFR